MPTCSEYKFTASVCACVTLLPCLHVLSHLTDQVKLANEDIGTLGSGNLQISEELRSTLIQSQAANTDDVVEQLHQTDNKLAQRSISITSDDILFEDHVFESKDIKVRDTLASEDQEVLLELNTEEQGQFEVLDSADGEDDKSQDEIKTLGWYLPIYKCRCRYMALGTQVA